MHTPAKVTIDESKLNEAILSQERTIQTEQGNATQARYLSLRILTPEGARFSQKAASYMGGTEYPEPTIGDGVTKLRIVLPFDPKVPLKRIAVLITPEREPAKAPTLRPLDEWIAAPSPKRWWEGDVALHRIEGIEHVVPRQTS
jgi:hypothetical protein